MKKSIDHLDAAFDLHVSRNSDHVHSFLQQDHYFRYFDFFITVLHVVPIWFDIFGDFLRHYVCLISCSEDPKVNDVVGIVF